MANDAFFDQVKKNLRVMSNDDGINQEIADLIESARNDLYVSQSITKDIASSVTNPLVKQAVVLYCKANFGLDNNDSEKYRAAYQDLADKLSVASQWKDSIGDNDAI
ncbi:head-tail connector protein [Oenococcus sicerae]|uniref:Phage gp6-like head-tail connector protein n=1 Tax=Oenococcus sicerae TaxID=2203724 RepID=A0AAJ1VME5_9LACO|nr:head-tail connector protein [Oenococcus sicerae]MDN6899571.1 phage gp6-like head-tail connector protein [Oenococcus sicerae]